MLHGSTINLTSGFPNKFCLALEAVDVELLLNHDFFRALQSVHNIWMSDLNNIAFQPVITSIFMLISIAGNN